MGILLDWVKANAKEGTNFAEFEELEGKNTFEGIKSKEMALEIIKKTPFFNSALDSEVNTRISTHDDKFRSEKLPTLLEAEREKIKNELNPPTTEEQKKIAEMQKTIDALSSKDKRIELESALKSKAKEFGFPVERAARFAVYGDRAESELKAEAEFYKTHIQTGVESRVKELYGDVKPPKQSSSDSANTMSRADFANLSPEGKRKFAVEDGGIITE